jgi:hypothetical protein
MYSQIYSIDERPSQANTDGLDLRESVIRDEDLVYHGSRRDGELGRRPNDSISEDQITDRQRKYKAAKQTTVKIIRIMSI